MVHSKGVHIIVFPEDAIINAGDFSRKQIAEEIAERIPDPFHGKHIPCDESSSESMVKTHRLSCLAKNNNIYIVADYGDRIDCDRKSDADCPTDGYYLFNTAVVFGPDGSVVTKYHKMQLFYEFYYNVPKPNFVHFDTPFGRMGLLVCFDLLYRNPSYELIERAGVTTMLLNHWWFDELPFRTAQQIHIGWSVNRKVNLLASNMFVHQWGSVGSGIYSGANGQLIASDIHQETPHLLIADVPIDSGNAAAKCLTQRHTKAIANPSFTEKVAELQIKYKMNLKDAAIVTLDMPQDSVNLCNNGFCCRLVYSIDSESSIKNYRFIVANRTGHGLEQVRYPLSEEICGLFRCDDHKCDTFSVRTQQVFKKLELSAKFSTKYSYPSVTSDNLELVPKQKWTYTQTTEGGEEVKMSLNDFEGPILTFQLYGRCYDRDPPYKQ